MHIDLIIHKPHPRCLTHACGDRSIMQRLSGDGMIHRATSLFAAYVLVQRIAVTITVDAARSRPTTPLCLLRAGPHASKHTLFRADTGSGPQLRVGVPPCSTPEHGHAGFE